MKNPLQAYFDRHGFLMTPWAKKNRIAPPVLSRYLNGLMGLSPKNARRISRATNEEVTEIELLYWEPERRDNAA